jgi:hypothetical protein
MSRSMLVLFFVAVPAALVVACGGGSSSGSGGAGGSTTSTSDTTTSATSSATSTGATSTGTTSTTSTSTGTTATSTGASTGTGMGMGACTDAADGMLLQMNQAQIKTDVGNCGKMNLAAEPATLNCIKMKTGLSDACSKCFSDEVDCAAAKCFAQCISDPASQGCTDCRAMNCDPAFLMCSGLPNAG